MGAGRRSITKKILVGAVLRAGTCVLVGAVLRAGTCVLVGAVLRTGTYVLVGAGLRAGTCLICIAGPGPGGQGSEATGAEAGRHQMLNRSFSLGWGTSPVGAGLS
jgi:hypothetical protein